MRVVGILLVSAGLVWLGDQLILQRSAAGPTPELTIRGDATVYIEMVEQGPRLQKTHVTMYRALVPALARQLPWPPAESLKVVSYASLFVFYLVALVACERLGLPLISSLLGLLTVFASPWQLYHYHNPFLTDAFALMCVGLLVWFLLERWATPFAIAAALGVLARETVLLLAPAWLATKQWWKSSLIIAASLAVFVISRWEYLGGSGSALGALMRGSAVTRLGHPWELLAFSADIFATWGFVWGLALLGMALIPKPRMAVIGTAFALLAAGAFLQALCFSEPDTGRYFAALAPIMVIACAQLYAALERARPWVLSVPVLLSVAQLFTGLPTVVTPRESWVFRGAHYSDAVGQLPGLFGGNFARLVAYGPRLMLVAAGAAVCLWIAIMLRKELGRALRAKLVTHGR